MEPQFESKFTYHVVELDDSPKANIAQHFDECIRFIDNAIKADKNNNVLVHCWAGISRSASIITSYLISTLCMSYCEALEHMRKARHWTDPNHGRKIFFSSLTF
jgi:dual specificity phosphatase 12